MKAIFNHWSDNFLKILLSVLMNRYILTNILLPYVCTRTMTKHIMYWLLPISKATGILRWKGWTSQNVTKGKCLVTEPHFCFGKGQIVLSSGNAQGLFDFSHRNDLGSTLGIICDAMASKLGCLQ